MPSDDPINELAKARDQRLRVDAGKVDVARLRLAAVDRIVFGASKRHGVDDHDRLLKLAVKGLFADG